MYRLAINEELTTVGSTFFVGRKTFDPGGKKYYMNTELYLYGKNNNLQMPTSHFFMGFHKEFLLNDFKKNLTYSNFFPNKRAYSIALDIYQSYINMYDNKTTYSTLRELFDKSLIDINPTSSSGIFFDQFGMTLKEDLKKLITPLKKSANYKTLRYLGFTVIDPITGIDLLFRLVEYVFAGKDLVVIFKISPKAEVRNLAKFEKEKQRTFAAPDYLFYIIGRMLYGDHAENLKHLSTRMMFGLTGFSHAYAGWDTLARKMLKTSKLWAADDISGMDGSYPSQMLYDSMMMRKIPILADIEVARKWYVTNTLFSFVMFLDGELMLFTGKNKSGDFLTLEHNNFASSMNILYSIVLNCIKNNLSPYKICSDFINQSCCPIMGDDSLRPKFHIDKCDMFDNFYVNCQQLGFTVASELENEYNEIEKLTFLNRTFVYNYDYKLWLARPNIDKIFSKIYFEFKERSWRYTLAKLIALRFVLFGFPELVTLDTLIAYVLTNHMNDMNGERQHDKEITMASLLAAYPSDMMCKKIVMGIESY